MLITGNYTSWKFHGRYITSWPFWFTKCLHGLAPSYLADELHHPAESELGRNLRSASSQELFVSRTRLSITYGDRACPVVAVRRVRIWNSLPQHITSALSLPVFCSRFKHTSSNTVIRNYCRRAHEVTLVFYWHVNRSYLLIWCRRMQNQIY